MCETERLYLREMNQADFQALCKILQDEETMYAYEGALAIQKYRSGLTDKFSDIKNGASAYGR